MVHIIYYIYARKFFYSFSEIRDFSAKLPISRLVSCFSNMLHDGFRHADGFTFSFALMQKNKVTKRKNQGYVSGPTPERPFWLWKMNSLRCTALRQHFSEPPVHSSAHAPTPRPILFFTPRRFAVGFGFYYLVLYTFMLTLWNIYQYRIDNSVFSHGILYT